MNQMPCEDFWAEARKRFGDDPRRWRFVCVSCGHTQMLQDFIDARVERPERYAGFSCIGRFVKGVGCDWTLGGLLTIHKLEVVFPDGKVQPSFELADPARAALSAVVAAQILAFLAARRFSCSNEEELQLAIAEAFAAAGISHEREVYLSSVDRIDFLVGDVAVEVKTKGSRAEVIRQLYRYASHSRVAWIVLATTRAQHRMPEAIGAKPVSVAYLGRL